MPSTSNSNSLQKIALQALEYLDEEEKRKIIHYIKKLIELDNHDKASTR
jgi:hypothetical protein